jgi:hypothetical protein
MTAFDLQRLPVRPALLHRLQHLPEGEHADHLATREHDQRADVLLVHDLDRLGDGSVGADGE